MFQYAFVVFCGILPIAIVQAEEAAATREEVTCILRLSGIGAKLLPPGNLEYYSPNANKPLSCPLDQFPVALKILPNEPAFFSFYDSNSSRVAAVITTKSIAVKNNEEYRIQLSKPFLETQVKRMGDSISVHHLARINDNTVYAALPRWDAKMDRLYEAAVPTLEIWRDSEALPMFVGKMESGCIGYGWVASPRLRMEPGTDGRLHVRVTHETGDLFGRMSHTVEWDPKS